MECRFYEQEYPDIEDFVMVKVTRVTETAAYVSLSEYDGMEGMILLSEVSTRRIRSMLKEIRVGQFCVCMVLTVNEDKGYVDLSRKRVNADDRNKYLARYAQSKTVHSILRQLAATKQIPMQTLCEKIAWPLYRKYKHALDAFKQYVADSKDEVFKTELGLAPELCDPLLSTIKRRLTPTAVKVKAKVKVTCFEYAGIDAIKAALLAGQALHTPDDDGIQVAVKVVAPPHYDVVVSSMGKEPGMAKIDKVLKAIEAAIKAEKGEFKIHQAAEVMGDDEEIMKMEEDENKSDSDGSSDSEASDVEGMGDIDLGK